MRRLGFGVQGDWKRVREGVDSIRGLEFTGFKGSEREVGKMREKDCECHGFLEGRG